MFNDVKAKTTEHLDKWFPERQIIHRTSGQINSFVIGKKAQIISVIGALFIAIWCVLTLGNLLWGHNPLRSPAKEVKRVEADYERRLANSRANEANALALLESQRQEFQQARLEFEQRHDVIRDIMSSRDAGGSLDTSAPITSVKYASSSVMMAPVIRDSLPRRSRSDIIETQKAEITGLSGTSLTNLAKDQNDILIDTEANAQDAIEYNRAILIQDYLFDAENMAKAIAQLKEAEGLLNRFVSKSRNTEKVSDAKRRLSDIRELVPMLREQQQIMKEEAASAKKPSKS